MYNFNPNYAKSKALYRTESSGDFHFLLYISVLFVFLQRACLFCNLQIKNKSNMEIQTHTTNIKISYNPNIQIAVVSRC